MLSLLPNRLPLGQVLGIVPGGLCGCEALASEALISCSWLPLQRARRHRPLAAAPLSTADGVFIAGVV